MDYSEQLAEGKTKVVYAHPDDAALAVLVHKDGITAGDGARRTGAWGNGTNDSAFEGGGHQCPRVGVLG